MTEKEPQREERETRLPVIPNSEEERQRMITLMNKKNQVFEVPRSRTLQHVWQGIVEGKFSPRSDEDIDRLIDEEYFQYTPLISLTPLQEQVIRDKLKNQLLYLLNQEHYKEIAEHQIVRPKKRKQILWNRTTAGTPSWKWQTVTVQEKMQLLQNPNILTTMRYQTENCESGLTGWGNRRLYEPDYYLFQKKKFPDVMKRIRDRTEKKLKVLDIGGGIGLGLHDAKERDPNIETYNLTIDEELAMYAVDHLYLCPAERMPKEFEGKMDLIMSNMAFRYFSFPDLALKNAIKALAVGGEAHIHWDTRDAHWTKDLDGKEYKTALQQHCNVLFQECKHMEDTDIIRILAPDLSKTGYDYYGGIVRVEKLKEW